MNLLAADTRRFTQRSGPSIGCSGRYSRLATPAAILPREAFPSRCRVMSSTVSTSPQLCETRQSGGVLTVRPVRVQR